MNEILGVRLFTEVGILLFIRNCFRSVVTLGALGAAAMVMAGGGGGLKSSDHAAASAKVRQKMASLSTRFIQNGGQWDDHAKFFSHARQVDVWVTNDGVSYDFHKMALRGGEQYREGQVVHMSPVGARKDMALIGQNKLNITTDFLSHDANSRRRAASYAGVAFKSVYPGIDMALTTEGGSPRYDFLVAPGADASKIQLQFKGADSMSVQNDQVALATKFGELRNGKLRAYQIVNGKKSAVSASFVKKGPRMVAFHLSSYNHRLPLVIDPLVYGSYYGGDGGPNESGFDEVRAVTTDSQGGTYLTGDTEDPRFPTIFGPYGFNVKGTRDAFISKLQGDAYSHDYAAYLGGSLDDYGQYVQVDPFGDVWIAGRTQSADFPGNSRPNVMFLSMTSSFPNIPTGGTFKLRYPGRGTSAAIAYNASPADVQTALEPLFGVGNVNVTSPGPTLDQGGTYRIELANQFPLLLQFTGNRMPAAYIAQERPLFQSQLLEVKAGSNAPTGGTYTLTFNGATTPPLAYNSTGTQIQAALAALPTVGPGNVTVVNTARPANDANLPFLIQFSDTLGSYPVIQVDASLLTGGLLDILGLDSWNISWDTTTSLPTGGVFFLDITTTVGESFTAAIPYNTNDTTLETAVTGAATVGAGNAYVTPPLRNLPNNGKALTVSFIGGLAGTQVNVGVFNAMQPDPVYGITKYSDIFVTRFKQSSTTVLDPYPTVGYFFGGDFDETLAGFAIRQNPNPNANTPIEVVMDGNTDGPIPDIPSPWSSSAWLARYHLVNGVFIRMDDTTRYVQADAKLDMRGVAMDLQGNAYIAGTVEFSGNADTSINPVFQTTPNVYQGGRLLRNSDIFARKYSPTGSLVYSTLIGGNQDDEAGGWDLDLMRNVINTGSAITVDSLGNAYVTGISRSFNFPRTRGVYGEVFDNSANVTVTKINQDASQLVYSTNLRTSNFVMPAGIAVDAQGDAFITGNCNYNIAFPEQVGQNPGDPDQPVLESLGSIQTTSDALDTAYTSPGLPELPTTEPFLNVLNSTGTQLLFGTYLGGLLDDHVFAPFVDQFGDVWAEGWTDSYRAYVLFSSTGNPVPYVHTPGTYERLPAGMISPLAFKANPDESASPTTVETAFGLISNSFFAAPTVGMDYRRDGFVIKYRVGLAAVQNVTVNPSTAPGGLGQTIAGTVTLTSPAPNGGADITLDLASTGAASFDPNTAVGEIIVNIPSGGTAANFTIYTSAVDHNTDDQVKATYLGSFKVAQFTVTPWLQQFSLSPTSIVGGNTVNGRITLAQPAPTGGAIVNLLTNSPSLITFPSGTTVTVPQGQTSVVFPIGTSGVATNTATTVTVSLLGVSQSANLTLTPANLKALSFSPPTIAAGGTSIGTISLDGQAGSDFTVDITLAPASGTPGYSVTTTPVTFHAGDTSATFTVNTPFEADNTQVVVTATRQAQGSYTFESIQGTLFVDAFGLTDFTVDPSSLDGGATATGTVTINAPAPTGGVVVALQSSDPAAVVPNQVVVSEGQTQATFNVDTTAVAVDTNVTLTASRGPTSKTVNLLIKGLTYTVSVDPASVVGGQQNATGTITLSGKAPAGGVTLNLSSDSGLAAVPGSVTIPAGATTGTFTITTTATNTPTDATITATLGTNSVSTTLSILPVGLDSITFSPSTVRGTRATVCTITLNAPAPAGGVAVSLSSSNPRLLNLPALITFAQGETSKSFSVLANRVSRNLATTVTATFSTSSVSTVVIVTR